jgi:Cupin domain
MESPNVGDHKRWRPGSTVCSDEGRNGRKPRCVRDDGATECPYACAPLSRKLGEVIYGLAAVTTFRVDGQDIAIEPGGSVFIKRGIVHGFRNDTQQAARCLCILTPGVLGPAYFREIAALTSGGAPDLVKMKDTMLRYGLVPVPPA